MSLRGLLLLGTLDGLGAVGLVVELADVLDEGVGHRHQTETGGGETGALVGLIWAHHVHRERHKIRG